MRIAFFNYQMLEFGGGVAKYFIEVAIGLKKRYPHLEISIINFDEKFLKWILFIYSLYFLGKQDKNISNKESVKDIRTKLKDIRYLKVAGISDLKKALKSFDVVYTTNNFLEVFIFKYLIGFKNLPPLIFGFHIPSKYVKTKSIQSQIHNFIYSSSIYLEGLKGAKNLHVVNEFDAILLKQSLPRMKIVKIYYPFDFVSFRQIDKAGLQSSINVLSRKKKIRLLWIGRLTEQKGVDDLLKLIVRLNSEKVGTKIEWIIAGEGELKRDIIDLCKNHQNIKYLGYIKNDQIGYVYNKCDLFISTSKWESFPYNLLEAQSFGLPVIAYDIHGCRDIITTGKNGFLCKNIDHFAKAITEEIRTKKLSKYEIKKYIARKFDREAIFKNLYLMLTNG